MLYHRVEIVDGESVEPVQFVGVYALNWGREQEPTVAFVEDEEATDRLDMLEKLARRLVFALEDEAMHHGEVNMSERTTGVLEEAKTILEIGKRSENN